MEEQIKQLVEAMNQQGASQEEIQRAISSMSSQEGETKKKGIIQSIAEPFLKLPTTAAAGAARTIGGIIGGAEGAERARQESLKGIDYGFFGNVKPLGADAFQEMQAGDISAGTFAKRAALETAGTFAEVASYGVAPLKGIKGAGFFETAFKQGGKFSAMFGVGKGLQAAGEGKSGTDVVIEGVGAYLGSALGYGITGKAATIIGNWGAKAMQSSAVKAAGNQIKNLAEKVWTAMPESFQKAGSEMVDKIVSASTRRAYNALSSEYAQTHKQAVTAFIDDAMPNVDRPDLSLAEFQRSLSSEMGNNFRQSNKLYDDFKAAQPITESAEQWTSTMMSLKKVGKETNPEISYLFKGIEQSLKQPTSPRMILSLWETIMQAVPKATNEEKVILRDTAASLYKDMRGILQEKDTTLLNVWDEAYQSWKKSVDLYESNPLNQLKSTGDVDTIIDKLASKTMTRPEQDLVLTSMQSNPEAVRDLFMNSLLRKAKQLPPEEGSKLIKGFLDAWDFQSSTGEITNTFLDPKQVKYLDDLSEYMGENFDDFIMGMREATGIPAEKATTLAEQKAQLSIGEMVDKGDFEGIATNWAKISGKEDFATALKTLSPEEKRVVGLSIFKDVYNENLPLIQLNKDGTVNMSAYADAFNKAYTEIERMGGAKKSNKLLKELYTPEQIADMQAAKKMIDTLKDVQEVPIGSVTNVIHLGLALIYSTFGGKYVGAVARHGGEAIARPSQKEFYQAVDTLIEQGLLKKNWKMNMSDVFRALELPAGAVGGQSVSEIL